jgi:hypothetical protein
MPDPEADQTLEMVGDARRRRRDSIGRSIAWSALFAVICLALLGFTGRGGVLARAEAKSGHATLDYPVVMRREATDDIVVRLDITGGTTVDVVLDPNLSPIVQLGEVVPRPVRTVAGPEGVRLVFELGHAPVDIVLRLRPAQPAWFQTYTVRAGADEMTFNTLILP